jgi:class 3 adenylate cyclase/tetratricopeptide (TPR) repeat protein
MQICSRCGEENPDRFRLCGFCGAQLAAPPETREERKVVSVLFVDLVGFTARSEHADPEDVRARLRPYHALVKQEIERFGGTVEKFVGDAVMAVFGAPVAHEDDAERAVHAGLRIFAAIDDLNQTQPGLELAVRAGINTGEAVVTVGARPEEGEGIAAGDVVNTAARLQQTAQPGTLVVGELTHRATIDAIDYDELEPVALKGKTGTVPRWLAGAPRGRLGIDLEPATRTPFLGRDHDLALLRDTFARTLRESSVQLVTVVGEPGVGKSRLVAEFRAWVDDRPELVYWRQGRCLPYGEGITFWALGEIVKGQAGILESDSPEQAAQKLEVAARRVAAEPADEEWLLAKLAPLVGTRPSDPAAPAESSESFAAWRRFLEGLASERPLVLVVEDLHWADTALLEFLEHLVDWATDVPLLLVCTARPELYERQAGWGGGKRNSTTIGLSPLTVEETARLISALLDRTVLPVETQTALLERAGGNPLYAEEFVRMLRDRGLLNERGELTADGDVPLPETVQALIAARVDTLAPERKALLHAAAVVGKVFWTGAVASVAEIDQEAVRAGLHELVRKELVRPARRSSVAGDEEFSFWHILVRDIAYGQIPRPARARKHRAAAAWIEAIAGKRVADHAELLAYHYEQALALARAAGDADQARKLEEPTRRFLVLAGDRAKPLDAPAAESYYHRALELFPVDDPERPKALLKGAIVLLDLSDAERRLEEALALFRANDDELGRAEALLELGFVAWVRGQNARARTLAEQATELLERRPPGRELALAYLRRAGNDTMASRPRESLAWSGRAIALAEKLDLRPYVARALQFRGIARCELGDVGGLEDLEQGLHRSHELGQAFETGTGHSNLGAMTWELESPAKGLEIHRAGIEFAERRGLTGVAMWIRSESTLMLFDLCRWKELLEVAEEVIEWARGQGGSQHDLFALPNMAQVLVRRGETAAAAALLDDFLPRAREARDPQVLALALVAAALVARARGDAPAAVRFVEEFEEATRGRADWHRARFLPDLVEICAEGGAPELARTLVESISVSVGRTGHSVVAARAVLADAENRLEEAIDLYEDAAERWAEYGYALGRGQALLGRGRCLVRRNAGDDAAAALHQARAIFAQVGARALLAATDDPLEQAVALGGS